MDPQRFDALAKVLATSRSRRYVLRALAGATVGGALVRFAAAQAPITPGGPPTATAAPEETAAETAPPEQTAAGTAPPTTAPSTAAASTAASTSPATTAAAAPATPGASACTTSVAGDQLNHAFRASFQDLTLVGEGRANLRGIDHQLAVTIARAGATVLHVDSSLTVDGVYTTTLHYGAMITGVREAILTSRDGVSTEGSVDGHALVPFTKKTRALRFADGTSVPQPTFPPDLRARLQELTTAAKGVLAGCGETTGVAPELGALLLRAIPAANGGDPTYGSPPRIDDPASTTSCKTCIVEAYGAGPLCGLTCGLSFGLACTCISGVPLAFARCHSPGQECCPVACGPTESKLGVSVVYQCCYGGDSCLDDATGECCTPGTQPCGKTVCCPSDAPCRDIGICCPTGQNTCVTADGRVCCNPGEDCVQGVCCAHGNAVCNGTCCQAGDQCMQGACCPSGNICNGACCQTGEDCTQGICCPHGNTVCNGTCCKSGEDCIQGICCARGNTVCSGACVDTASDPKNCSACGTVCPAGVPCQGGVCIQTQTLNCTSKGQSNCNGKCVDTNADNANCGACGHACAAGVPCQGGVCVQTQTRVDPCVLQGLTDCGGQCVDTKTDGANCGACGTACPAGGTCTGGVCGCPSGQTACNGSCVDTSSNNANCGTCGHACDVCAPCQGGSCVSLPDQTLCSAGVCCTGQCQSSCLH